MTRELTYGWLHKIILKRVEEIVSLDDTILDVWCWFCAFLEKMNQKGYQKLHWTDWYIQPEIEGINFKKWLLHEKLPYEDGSFDSVFCIKVIEHVENPFFLIREMLRVLKKWWKLHITSPNIDTLISKVLFTLTGRLAYFSVNDAKFTYFPGHISPFFSPYRFRIFFEWFTAFS